MERTHRLPRPRAAQTPSSYGHAHGAAIVETVIALPILLAVILGAIQFGLIYQAKATLNHASLQAARAGAVGHAQPAALRNGLARGLAPLYSPDSSIEGVTQTVARIDAELLTEARIRILNPTREAFEDFGEDVDGEREIPNDRLHARSTSVGALSGINIQDANLLRVEVMYGYELKVPLVNWFIARVLLTTRRDSLGAFEQQLLRRVRLPIVATATVRMQSPARLSDAVVARGDLPEIDRIPADARPPDDNEENDEEEAPQPGDSGAGDDGGSNLADGFFGFGEGSSDGSGGGSAPGNDGGSSGGGGGGGGGFPGGGNSGNPAQCPADGGGSGPFPPAEPPPGDSSPLPRPSPWPDDTASIPTSLPSLSVGNPIHVVTGNKYQAETDLAPLPGLLGLTFVRHYNSEATTHAGVMGAGWRHGYEASLRVSDDTIEIWQSDGRIVRFVWTEQPNRFTAQRSADGSVEATDAGYLWRWRTGRELKFDREGRLVSIQQHGRALRLLRDAQGRLEQVIDPQHRALRFEYFANGRISIVRGMAGASWRYTYDDKGNLAAVIAADGRARRYEYSDVRHPHHLTAIRAGAATPGAYGSANAFQLVARWAYDERGRGILSSHPDDAGKVTLDYGDGYTDVTDAFGRVSRYVTRTRDGISLVTEVRGPGCGTCGRGDVAYEFDAGFQLTQLDTKQGLALRYMYDELHRLTQVERNDGSGFRWIERYRYEGQQDRPAIIQRPSVKPDAVHTVAIQYRPDGQVREVQERGYAPAGDAAYESISRTHRFRFDDAGRLVSIDGPRTDVEDVSRIEYDSIGRVVLVRSPVGDIHRIREFDAAGRPVLIERTGAVPIHLAYDVNGRLVEKTELRSAGERRAFYEYDTLGRLATIRDSTGRSQRIDYDLASRPNRVRLNESGIAAVLKYASDGNVVAAAIVDRDDQLLRGVRYVYDDQRRLIEIRDGDGPPLRQMTYDDESLQPARIVDPLGNVTGLSYDWTGALQSIVAPDGGETRFDRDLSGRLSEVTAPNDAQTRYVRDDFGRRVREHNADRGTLLLEYDAAGNVITRTDARGVTVRYAYDADNRLARIDRREGRTTLRYRNSRLIDITGPEAREQFEYDSDGQLIRHVSTLDGHRFITANAYDAQGHLRERTLPSGERLRYTHDARGRLTAIRRGLSDQILLGRTAPAGQTRPLDAMGQLDYGNGLTMSNVFDDRTGRLIQRTTPGIATFSYEHDDAGRITQIHDGRASRSFGYDATGRLTFAQTAGGVFRYGYDSNGNRIIESARKFSGPGRRNAQRLPASERLLHLTHSDRTAAPGHRYDAAGNPVAFGQRRYEYNSEGRPTRLYIDDRLVATYAYNAHGERIRKTVFGDGTPRTSFYLYDQQRLVAEADDRGAITREYLYSGHHPVAMLDKGRAYWIHTDHLGTPYAVTDETRRIVWHAEHEPFGLARVNEDPDGDTTALSLHLRFPGQYADTEAGTHYNLMRDYDPTTGRYLTPDPLGLFDGTNQYVYVHGNPVSAIDPYGLYQQDIHYYMTLFLGITAGIDPRVARDIALAAAFVDENPFTRPADDTNHYATISSIRENQPQLLLYHFVLSDSNTGQTLAAFENSNYRQVYSQPSPQLAALFQYATSPPRLTSGAMPCDASRTQAQFFGEYLHAFEDAYSHRNRNDRPFDALIGSFGLGHGLSGHQPDYTYDSERWSTRSARTLAMELDARDKLRATSWADPARATTAAQFDQLLEVLTGFNAIREDEQSILSSIPGRQGDLRWLRTEKIEWLNHALARLGYGGIDLASDEFRYDANRAYQNRIDAFRDLDADFYTRAILQTDRAP